MNYNINVHVYKYKNTCTHIPDGGGLERAKSEKKNTDKSEF